MNLVTADNFKLFNKEGKGNILIGSWCLNNEEIKKNFNKDKDIIANYHWDQKEKISKDVTYIEKIYMYCSIVCPNSGTKLAKIKF